MQILSEEFCNWIHISEYSKIKLSGPLNHIVTCKLGRNTQNGEVEMYFGKGWKKFCQKNNIVEGSCLEFTNDGFMHTNVFIVEKI
jgi:hypothetical protein